MSRLILYKCDVCGSTNTHPGFSIQVNVNGLVSRAEDCCSIACFQNWLHSVWEKATPSRETQ